MWNGVDEEGERESVMAFLSLQRKDIDRSWLLERSAYLMTDGRIAVMEVFDLTHPHCPIVGRRDGGIYTRVICMQPQEYRQLFDEEPPAVAPQ